jgi:tetratricopeptide (TPR) repeat protein
VISATATTHDPDGAKSKLALAQAVAALRAGNAAGAEQTLRLRLFEQPDDLDAHCKLAEILAGQGRHDEAIAVYTTVLSRAPGADRVRFALAVLLGRQHQPHAALAEIERLQISSRSTFDALSLEAALLGQIGRHEHELATYEKLLAAHPRSEVSWLNYGNALKTAGRTAEAIRAIRRALKLRPGFGAAYWSLANLKTFRFGGREIASMRKALQDNPDESDALHLHFALAKALEDRGEVQESFKHYAAGNRIQASRLAPAQLDVTPHVDSAIRTFTKELFEGRSNGCGDPGPIFVLGLQRSGSTLIEQILASHPMVEGVAELLVVDQLWLRLAQSAADPFSAVRQLSADARRELGADYFGRTRPFRLTDKPLFVDKQAGNWVNVGFIKLILPNAKIIDTRRHPMACGLSNFKQLYDAGVFFSYSLESIGRCYSNYLRLMNHFDEVLPGSVHHVLNERLIDDPEGEIRRLLDYVGVPFDPACLEFHKTKRAVHSASSEQVRRPINREGVDYWRRFEPWLGPLKETLGEALEDWDKVPA